MLQRPNDDGPTPAFGTSDRVKQTIVAHACRPHPCKPAEQRFANYVWLYSQV